MEAKLKAVGKLQLMEEKKRDRIGLELANARQRYDHLHDQVQKLSELKRHSGQSALMTPTLNSTTLMNLNRVDQMLQKLLLHHEYEQAVIHAQCTSMQKQLEHKHARVKGLEKVLDSWRVKQRYEKAKKEQKLIEDTINSRLKRNTP
ncbi:flagellar export protein FliJ [Vibrio metschnikovii]|uniref:flagellar export protein FliJ n=1 Tax=Vibrio metschnikovii TaxID=28172 RepID=UPI0029794D6C|nr:flagellar export protein FliJ [Vibrio metschnikovii]EKO3658502.1 flagellar export protein FliJ [Vibrio metschnikovii]